MKRQDGVILIVVLFFLQLFSLLSLNSMQLISRVNQLTNEIKMLHHENEIANQGLQYVEKNLFIHVPPCLLPVTEHHVLKKAPLQWWQRYACSGNLLENQYYYVIEPLGMDECALINFTPNHQRLVADYYRITLRYQLKQLNEVIHLQSTIAKPYLTNRPCLANDRRIAAGRQMYRTL